MLTSALLSFELRKHFLSPSVEAAANHDGAKPKALRKVSDATSQMGFDGKTGVGGRVIFEGGKNTASKFEVSTFFYFVRLSTGATYGT
jgi:hypothetical protein